MTLVRKNKVESSPHFNEIIKRLSEGESSRKLSAYLKNQYNEDISHAALNRYANKHIKMENRVEAELNKRAAKKKNQPKESTSKEKKVKSKTEDIVQKKADSIEEAERCCKGSCRIARNVQKNKKPSSRSRDNKCHIQGCSQHIHTGKQTIRRILQA